MNSNKTYSYKDLIVWQKAIQLTTKVYNLTNKFPKEEVYGLTSQIRRCTVSIPSNIAEGYTRHSKAEYIQFLKISFGSAAELETQLFISKNLKFISENEFNQINNLLQEVLKMLNSLIRKMKF